MKPYNAGACIILNATALNFSVSYSIDRVSQLSLKMMLVLILEGYFTGSLLTGSFAGNKGIRSLCNPYILPNAVLSPSKFRVEG